MKKFLILASLALISSAVKAQTYLNPQAPIEERVKDALKRMTTEEKIKILHAQSKFTSAGVPRLGIRQLNMDDGPHGVREELEWNTWSPAKWTNDYIVAFPSLTCLAATWNRDLSNAYGNAVSEEFAFRGKDIMLGPGVNIQRTPMNGRAFEYMGEDPYLAGEIVVPYIKAAQKNGIACCLKHFVLNDQEIDRFSVNVNVSERALHEIYLYPFKQAVERAHVWTIMGSYNLWEGDHCCHNDKLINGILKKDWNWDGALVSDWGGTTNTMQAIYGGLDIEMGTYTDGKLRESAFGYDDYYLAKPFAMPELVARVGALVRRSGEIIPDHMQMGNITLNRQSYELGSPSGEIRLSKKEYQMMEMLMKSSGRPISTESFMTHIWGYESEAEVNVVWVYISYLRKKLAALNANVQISALRGRGYILEAAKNA